MTAVGAAGLGAGAAALTRRRGAPGPTAPRPSAPGAVAPPDVEPPAVAPARAAPPTEPSDDPRAALDAARERLRRHAEELRGEIEGGAGA